MKPDEFHSRAPHHWFGIKANDDFWFPPARGFLGGGIFEHLVMWTYIGIIMPCFFFVVWSALFGGLGLLVLAGISFFGGSDSVRELLESTFVTYWWTAFHWALYPAGIGLVLMGPLGDLASRIEQRERARLGVPVGEIEVVPTLINDLPTLRWTDEIATGETVGDQWDSFQRGGILLLALLFGYAGFMAGGLFAALFGAAMGLFGGRKVCQLIDQLRPGHAQSQYTGLKRSKPVTAFVDCTAFVMWSNQIDDYALFIVRHARTPKQGELAYISTPVRWDSFTNFEEGPYGPWFRSATQPSSVQNDRAVIVQPHGEARVLVSHSVDPAFTDKLRAALEKAFVVGREETLIQWKQERQAEPFEEDARVLVAASL